jgi:hypothetical protein
MTVQNKVAKKLYIFEFACPFARVGRNGDSLKLAYDFKEGKYRRLSNFAKERFIGWDVQLVTVIVSSLGAVYKDSLKRLASVLELSPTQTTRLGQRLSDAAISGSYAILRHYQHEISKMASDIDAAGTTSEIDSTSMDYSEFEQPSSDIEGDNNNNQTVVTDCTPEELEFGRVTVKEAAKEDNVFPPEDEGMKAFDDLLEDEDDNGMPEDDADVEYSDPDPDHIVERENYSEIESPKEESDSSEWEPRRLPRPPPASLDES